jgi:hypothetical protein
MKRYAVAAAIILGLLTAPPARAAEIDVLKAIPTDAMGFLLINRLDKTSEKLAKVAQLVQAPAPPLLMLAKMQTGIQAGVDDSGTAAAVMMPPAKADGAPALAILLPVTDYKQLLAQLRPEDPAAMIAKIKLVGSPWLVAKKGQFAVLMADEGNNEQTLGDFINSTTSVAGAVKPLQKRLFANDIAIALTPDGVARVFEKLDQGLSAGKGGIPLGGKQADAASAGIDALQDFLKTCQKEISHFAAGIHIDDDGNIDLGTWSIFVPAGEFTRAAQDATAPEWNVMAGLPADHFWFAMGGVMPESWSKAVANLSVKMMKLSPGFDQMTDEQADKLAKVTAKSMLGTRGVAMSMGVTKLGESMYANTFSVVRVEDSAAYLANSKKSFELMAEIGGDAAKLYEVKQLKIAEYDAVEITMDMAALSKAGGANEEATKKALEKLVGPDGKLKTYLAAIDPKTIAFTYVHSENIQRLATSIKSKDGGLVGDADVAVTAGLLPTGGQWVGYLSPAGMIDFVRSTLENAGPAVPKIPVPDFPTTPPVGATAKMLSIGMETHLVVPAKVLTAGGQYFKQFPVPQAVQIQIQPGGPGGPPVAPPPGMLPPAAPKKPRRPAQP